MVCTIQRQILPLVPCGFLFFFCQRCPGNLEFQYPVLIFLEKQKADILQQTVYLLNQRLIESVYKREKYYINQINA